MQVNYSSKRENYTFVKVLPQSLIQSLKNVTGFDEESFVQTHQDSKPITSVRLNDLKIIYNLFAEAEPVDWCRNAYYLPTRPYFTHDPLLHAGAYYVQEASSMFLWQVLQQTIGSNTQKTVLDVCAAPGGKSTLLANYFKDGLVVSNEVIKQRCNILVENITKWGSENVIVTNKDATHFKKLNNFFDVMVIDAPCSGSGLFRKDKDTIAEWSEDNVNLCSQRQQRIVADVMDCLNDDGILVYSTCSYSKKENEEIVDWILNEFEVSSIQINIEEKWGITETLSDDKKGFGYRFYPNKVKGEGFFIAAFKKNCSKAFHQKHKEKNIVKATKQEVEAASKFIINGNDYFYFKHNDAIRIINKKWLKHLQIISNNLFIRKAGIELGALKGKDLIPSHELAMSNLCGNQFKKININKSEALQYLSKKQVIINTDYTGWVLLQYHNINLGWAKFLQNRMNNYYPTDWRIININFKDDES